MHTNHSTQRLARNLAAIFSGADDRIIVLLRVSPLLLQQAAAIRWIEHLRDTYEGELEILLLLAAPAAADAEALRLHGEQLHALANRSEATPPFVIEIEPSRALHQTQAAGLSAWALWNTGDRHSQAFPCALADESVATPASTDLGWLVPFGDDDALNQVAMVMPDASNTRRAILDLKVHDIVGSARVQLARLATDKLINGDQTIAGLAISLISSREPSEPHDVLPHDSALQIDVTEAMLDAFANAVYARRIGAFTRSGSFSLSVKL